MNRKELGHGFVGLDHRYFLVALLHSRGQTRGFLREGHWVSRVTPRTAGMGTVESEDSDICELKAGEIFRPIVRGERVMNFMMIRELNPKCLTDFTIMERIYKGQFKGREHAIEEMKCRVAMDRTYVAYRNMINGSTSILSFTADATEKDPERVRIFDPKLTIARRAPASRLLPGDLFINMMLPDGGVNVVTAILDPNNEVDRERIENEFGLLDAVYESSLGN